MSRPSSTGGGLLNRLIGTAVGVVILAGWFVCGPPHDQTAPRSSGTVNPIDNMLKSNVPTARKDGVAVAVLVDTSGSMDGQVADGAGGQQPKIAIARQSLVRIVDQAQKFAAQHADSKLVLGIYEFSGRSDRDSCRPVVPIGPPDPQAARRAVETMTPGGDTPIGDAMLKAKYDLDSQGLKRMHILVITDGENNHGYALDDVVSALARQGEEDRAAFYFIAFDTGADKFKAVRESGGTVLSAANASELQQTLEYVLSGRILVEQPAAPLK